MNNLFERGLNSLRAQLTLLKKQHAAFLQRPVLGSPIAMVTLKQDKLRQSQATMGQIMTLILQRFQSRIMQASASLSALSPYAVIERGYALTTTASGQVIHTLNDIRIGDVIVTQLKDGTFTSEVKKKG